MVLRFSIVLLTTVVHLIGMDVVSARRDAPQRMYSSDRDAQFACQRWREREGEFSVTIPRARLGGEPGTFNTLIRRCEADLDHPVVYGVRYSVLAGAHYSTPLSDLHQKVIEHFPYPMEDSENEPSS